MSKKDPYNDPKLPNLVVLRSFRLSGDAVPVGAVIAKSDFSSTGEWQNLAHMTPPKVEETAAKVGAPTRGKAELPT